MAIHDAAARGFTGAERYERSRPDYPAPALEALAAGAGIAPASTVVEVGAGTGKMTRLLLARARRVVAVEPVEAMRRALRSSAPAALVAGGQAEALPLRRGCADAVVVAQAFHWFDGPAALREFHRVLRPGGGLALVWNQRDESVPWVARLGALIEPHAGGAPRARDSAWRRAFESQDLFAPLARASFANAQRGPPERIVERIASVSFVAAMGSTDRDRLLDSVRALLRGDPATAGRETVELPYRTDVFWTSSR